MTNLLPSATRFDWSDAAVARLRELVALGRTATQIAEIIDAPTRNVVIGKAHRLGLTFNQNRTAPHVFATPSKRRAAPPRNAPAPKMSSPPEAAPMMQEVEAMPFVPPAGGVRLLDAVAGQCRWPIGDPRDDVFRFCGVEAKDGSPYCDDHHGIAYRPAEKRVNARPAYRALSHREVLARAAS